ncbi:rhomboid family intramembrane serine protease [Corallincola luteus]|uniref:Rhomboid family intramembrane serine protease n=1 Tax=Corallincola luteus TaxID=1775177 RepID=A0ABY2AHR5_9GAMM|nr:rhomboid family intramembrane serine protease [Corallincola luteus]TCI01974.1 rhomboid family intramembrane serine protease [Corallincola luteus]
MKRSDSLGHAITVTAIIVGFLWLLKLGELLLGWNLHNLGVYPSTASGFIGVFTGPLIHGSIAHISANSVGLMVLGSALLYGYPRSRWWVLGIVWIVSGLGVWLWGRESYHFGASGLTHGLFFYLFFVSLFRRDKRSIALMMIAFFMFGGMLLTVFPREPGISFEYHLFGGIGGLVSALLFWRWDPKPEEKKYSWELEPEAEDIDEVRLDQDPIGDLWQRSPEHAVATELEADPEASPFAAEPNRTQRSRPIHISRN